jgi:hypothetical protein
MVIQFETRAAREIRLARAKRLECVRLFRGRYERWSERGERDTRSLCAEAASSFDSYASQALDALRFVNPAVSEGSGDVAAHYLDGFGILGIALRDAVTDASARHAVAQTLQERTLLAELSLRQAMRQTGDQAISWPPGQRPSLRRRDEGIERLSSG